MASILAAAALAALSAAASASDAAPAAPGSYAALLGDLQARPAAIEREDALLTLLRRLDAAASTSARRELTAQAAPVLARALRRKDLGSLEKYRLLKLSNSLADDDPARAMRLPDLVEALVALPIDGRPEHRGQEIGLVASVLGRIGGLRAAQHLKAMAHDEDRILRHMAVAGLAELRDPVEAGAATEFLMGLRAREQKRAPIDTALIAALDRTIAQLALR